MALHRYSVEWSAPNYREAGMTTVMASTAPGAVAQAKRKLGNKVKSRHLSRFRAWKSTTKPRTRRSRSTSVYNTSVGDMKFGIV